MVIGSDAESKFDINSWPAIAAWLPLKSFSRAARVSGVSGEGGAWPSGIGARPGFYSGYMYQLC